MLCQPENLNLEPWRRILRAMSPDKPSQQPVHDWEEAVRNFLKGLQMPERHATAFMMQYFEVSSLWKGIVNT